MRSLSMFAGGGIAETYFESAGIHVAVANELLEERAAFHHFCHPEAKMICGDITDDSVFNHVVSSAKAAGVDFLMATPPCQGMSTLGKKEYGTDARNELFWYAIKAIQEIEPDYALIENVPKFLKLLFTYDKEALSIVEILKKSLGKIYTIEAEVLNAVHYGVPQSRPRAIIKLYKHGLSWAAPLKHEQVISLKEAIGDLPPLEPGESSQLKWHSAVGYSSVQAEALRHTPEGQSALNNPVFYPKKKNGDRIKGFHNTYKRMRWSEPAPARTTNSYLVSGHNNVHPGRLLPNGLWSDPRALTLRELIIVSSLPLDWDIPSDIKEPFLRQIIGEAIPPLLSKAIVEMIGKERND